MSDENTVNPEDEIMHDEENKNDNVTKVIEENTESGVEKDSDIEERIKEKLSGKIASKLINKLFFKILFVIIPIFIIIYIIFFTTTKSDVTLLLSSNNIHSLDIENKIIFPLKGDIYFYIKGKGEIINADMIKIEIHYFDESNYNLYKDIYFGIDKNFKKLSSYLQGEYFSKKGKYKINIFLDDNLKTSKEILIE